MAHLATFMSGLAKENPDNVETQPVDMASALAPASPPKTHHFDSQDVATKRAQYQNVKDGSETLEFPVAEPSALPDCPEEVPVEEPKVPNPPQERTEEPEEAKVLSHHKMIQNVLVNEVFTSC